MERVFYAINNPQFEKLIENALKDTAITVYKAAYKDAILSNLASSNATVLLLIESLQGTPTIEQLLRTVRQDFPKVRIILITKSRPDNDPLLGLAVGLGIYDIVNKDNIPYTDIADMVNNPRTFADVLNYSSIVDTLPATGKQTAENKTEKKGFLTGFFQNKKNEQTVKVEQPVQPEKESFDIQLLRQTIEEEATRKAQENFDTLLQKAINDKTSELLQQNTRLEQIIKDKESMLTSNSTRILALEAECRDKDSTIDTLKNAKDKAEKEMSIQKTVLEDQIKSLQSDYQTPEWYSKKEEEWASKQDAYETKIQELSQKLSNQQVSSQGDAGENNAKLISENTQLKTLIEGLVKDNKAKDETITNLNKASIHVISGAGDTALAAEVSELKDKLADAEKQIADDKISIQNLTSSLKTANDAINNPDSFKNQEIEALRKENESLKQNMMAYDLIEPEPMAPESFIYTGTTRVIAVTGSQAGIGCSTVALNLGTMLAKQGQKTLIIEMNYKNPSIGDFLEINTPLEGLTNMANKLKLRNMSGADNVILRLPNLRCTRQQKKIYSNIPLGLHFVIPSSEEVVNYMSASGLPIKNEEFSLVISYLKDVQKYQNIILDIPADDYNMMKSVFECGVVNRIVGVLGGSKIEQKHSKAFIARLMKFSNPQLVASGGYILNKQVTPVKEKRFAAEINIPVERFLVVESDVSTFNTCEANGLPYVLLSDIDNRPMKELARLV